MWNITNTYHSYNLDVNNEIPYECVPNALNKCYGDRERKNREFIAKIAKGGIEYIKNVLKTYYQEELKALKSYDVYSKEELNEMQNEGFSPNQILRFCNDHKIRCFGFDWKMRQFITNKNSDIKLNTKLPAFVFYFNDKHIYIVSDPKIKKSLLNSNSKSELMSLLSLEAKKESKNDREHKVDIPFEQWGEGEKLNIYITKNREVNDQFYKLICNGHIYNHGVKSSEKEGIIKFTYENKNVIIYNPDYHTVNKTIDNLNKVYENKYTFKNQRITKLTMQ